jgi:hypothetical protein
LPVVVRFLNKRDIESVRITRTTKSYRGDLTDMDVNDQQVLKAAVKQYMENVRKEG